MERKGIITYVKILSVVSIGMDMEFGQMFGVSYLLGKFKCPSNR
jgi:hypothetical protein